MYEILDAIKYWILHKLDIDEKPVEENRDEILYLRAELTIAREEISRLTNLMYNASVKPELVDKIEEENPEPIRAQFIPWHLRREKLERESRIKAESLRKEVSTKIKVNVIKPEPVKSVDELEEELLEGVE